MSGHATLLSSGQEDAQWITPYADSGECERFGIRAEGGGTHQAKTMMLRELEAVLSDARAATPTTVRELVLTENILDKQTASARSIAFRHLNMLYGIESPFLAGLVLRGLWPRDPQGRALLALLCALARDPLLRASADAVLGASTGSQVRWPSAAVQIEEKFPDRFTDKMLKSLAQNCVSSWTQSGHLHGKMKKLRRRVAATPPCAAYAALLASTCGFGGPALLSSPWIRVLDLSPDQALSMLRQAEAKGLARVRSAGDVIEISIRKPMATMLGIPDVA